jgi:hypothetical protein
MNSEPPDDPKPPPSGLVGWVGRRNPSMPRIPLQKGGSATPDLQEKMRKQRALEDEKSGWQEWIWLLAFWYGFTGFIIFLTPTKQSIIRDGWDPLWTWLGSPLLIPLLFIFYIVVAAVAAPIIYFLWRLWRVLTDADAKEAEDKRKQDMISRLSSENMHLRDRVRELERDGEY